MTFKPSKYSNYGWSDQWPESRLTVGSQRGLPIASSKRSNASLLSDFLAKIPFKVGVNSGYRSPAVNASIPGASSSSQHMNALAVDLDPPPGMTNDMLAAWFYFYQWMFPELDQVITYHDGRKHLHVGICPKGATGCVSGAPRRQFQQFYVTYGPWVPTPWLLLRPLIIPPKTMRNVLLATTSVGLVVAAYAYQDELRDKLGL